MKNYKTELVPTEVLEDIICDCCGQSCKTEFDDYNFMSIESHWIYPSQQEQEIWTAQLCEKCANERLNFIPFRKDVDLPF